MQGKDYSKTTIINNRYSLKEYIGRGSYGEVWLAEDLQLGINVAIKMYAALDDNGIAEFKNEFKSVYKLHHPNLLRPDYFDTDEGRPYLVMPYCPTSASGQAGKMSEAEIWGFIRDVASGLAYLHANEVVHRDIKPANILREGGGAYVITDFGLSVKMRSSLRQASLRQSRGVGKTERKGTPLSEISSGTIPYMAPELFSSKPISVKATDIWALGVSIYELATGELPFVGQGGGMLNAGAGIPDLDSGKWSDKLNDLLHRCLSKATWERPTAKDIVEKYCKSDRRDDKPQDLKRPIIATLVIYMLLIGSAISFFLCLPGLIRSIRDFADPDWTGIDVYDAGYIPAVLFSLVVFVGNIFILRKKEIGFWFISLAGLIQVIPLLFAFYEEGVVFAISLVVALLIYYFILHIKQNGNSAWDIMEKSQSFRKFNLYVWSIYLVFILLTPPTLSLCFGFRSHRFSNGTLIFGALCGDDKDKSYLSKVLANTLRDTSDGTDKEYEIKKWYKRAIMYSKDEYDVDSFYEYAEYLIQIKDYKSAYLVLKDADNKYHNSQTSEKLDSFVREYEAMIFDDSGNSPDYFR